MTRTSRPFAPFSSQIPPTSSEIVPEISPELKSVIATCLEKNPGARYASAAEVREALKTIMKALQIETGIIPGEAAANLPTTGAEAEKRATGFLSMLAERFRESAVRARAAKLAGRPALCQSGRNRGGSALWLRARRRHRRPSGAHSRARRPPLQHAHAAAHRSDGPARCRPKAAGLLCAGRQLSALRRTASISTGNCSMWPRKACAPAAPSASLRSI